MRRHPKREFLVEIPGTEFTLRVCEWGPMAGGGTWAAEILLPNGNWLPGASGRTMLEAIEKTTALIPRTRGKKHRVIGGPGGRS